jgi:tetratricopeptide (TPR) repeat protein
VYSNLATLYYYESRYEESAKMYEKALKLDDHDHHVWGGLASALRWSGVNSSRVRSYYEKALMMAEQDKSVNPRDAQLLVTIAGYHTALGDYDIARRYLDEALDLAPDNILVMGYAGRIYEKLGDRDRARSLITSAIERGYSLTEIENDPDLLEFRSDSGFVRFMSEFTAIKLE